MLFLHLIQTVFILLKGNEIHENKNQISGQILTGVRTIWWLCISVALSSGSAPAPHPALLALPAACSKAQGPFGLDLFCSAVCPLDILCCKTSHILPHFPQCVQEGSDRSGQSASPLGADAASTSCSEYWKKKWKQFFIMICIYVMIVLIWAVEPTCSHTPKGSLPVVAVTGSKGLREPRTGQNGGRCETSPAHGAAEAQTGKLREREDRCLAYYLFVSR